MSTAQGDAIRANTLGLEEWVANLTAERDAAWSQVLNLQTMLTEANAEVERLEIALAECEGTEEPPPPLTTNVVKLAGAHVLHQFPQAAGASKSQAMNELNSQTQAIKTALAAPGVSAFCARVPWNIIDTDFQILDQARQIAFEMNKEFTVRFMAGRHTPSRIFSAMGSAWTLSAGSTSFPRPYNSAGAHNSVFLNEYAVLCQRLSNWCMANDVRMIHLSHYAKDWAEFYFGPEIQAILSGAAGQTAMVNATLSLADAALAYTDPTLSLELPMSGHGPVMRTSGSTNPGIAERVAAGLSSRIGGTNDRFFIQGNGVDQDGIWGAPSESTEVLMDYVLNAGLFFGGQMIQPYNTYAWSSVFDQVQGARASYLEVYLPSFSGGTSGELRAETQFAADTDMWRTA